MNDFEAMQFHRRKWVRQLAAANLPMASEQALAAYHRGFYDALAVALERVIEEEKQRGISKDSP